MEDLIFYPGGHPVTKNDFLSLKNRFDKSIFALLESFDPDNKYKAIMFNAEITKVNSPYNGNSSTYIFSGTDGYVYHKVKKQIYALNYTKDFATYTNSQGSNHVDNEVACIIFPEDSTYEKEATDPVEYESATNGQGASYDCHVTRTALYGNQLTFPSGATLPPGYESYTTYDSDQSVSETLVLKDLTLKYNNAVINSDLYKSLKGQYDLDHKFITSIASNYPNDGSAGVGKLKVNTLDVDNFKIDGIQHDIAEVFLPILSEEVISNPGDVDGSFIYNSTTTENAQKQLELPPTNELSNLLTNSNLHALVTNINYLKTYLTPISIDATSCAIQTNIELAYISKGLLTKFGNIVTGNFVVHTTGAMGSELDGNRPNIIAEGVYIGNLPSGFRLKKNAYEPDHINGFPDEDIDIVAPGNLFMFNNLVEYPNANEQASLKIKKINDLSSKILVFHTAGGNSCDWVFNFSYLSEI